MNIIWDIPELTLLLFASSIFVVPILWLAYHVFKDVFVLLDETGGKE